ncbi:MAG: transcription elongation factor GreA [Fimbriimonadaceae bacterium]
MSEHVLTRRAYERLEAELARLKGPVRAEVADAIREAKSHGDLRENAAYHEAKLNQQRLDSRLQDLEKLLQLAKIVEGSGSDELAELGGGVKLLDLEFGDELDITLVSSFEADPANDLISISSPLGGAVLGKAVGDEIEVEAPAGTQRYRVVSIFAATN